jgi:hypothetical protein
VRLISCITVLLISGGTLAAQEELAAPVRSVLSSLAQHAGEEKPARQRIAFEFPDVVVNSYLASVLGSRPGIESASAKFLAGNRVSFEARLNFDQIAAGLPQDQRQELSGTLPVSGEATFQMRDGAVAVTLGKFLVNGKALAPPLAMEVVSLFGALQPEKFNPRKPVPLPFGLRKLSTTAGVISGDTGQ